MTLNIILNQFVAVDSEGSMGGRTSDNFEKSEIIKEGDFHGVLIGNGSSLTLQNAILIARESPAKTPYELMEKIQENRNKSFENWFNERERIIERDLRTKLRLVPNLEEHLPGAYKNEIEGLLNSISKNESSGHGSIYLVAYNKEKELLEKYRLPDVRDGPILSLHLQRILTDGSGHDLSNAFMTTQTSGINWDDLSEEKCFYLLSLACSAATANAGVGGYMKVIKVDSEDSRYIDDKIVNASVRICGKQIAGDISKKEAIALVSEVYNGDSDYSKIARKMGIKKKDLLYSPCNIHQDVSRFNTLNLR